MKTYILSLVVVLGLGNYAWAQQMDSMFNQQVAWSHEATPAKSLMQALDDLRDPSRKPEPIHFHVEVNPQFKSKANAPCLQGRINNALHHVITRMANICGIYASFNHQTVTLGIMASASNPAPAQRFNKHEASGIDLAHPAEIGPGQVEPVQPTSQPRMALPTPNTLRRTTMDYQANVANAVYTTPQPDPLLTFQADMIRSGLGCTMIGPLRPPQCDYGYGGGFYGGYYPNMGVGRIGASQPGPGGLGMWWYADCNMFPNDRNCTHGDLKIDGGSESLLQQVNIYVDGINRGPASRFNNRFNDPLVLTTGEHFVQFVWIKDDTYAYETMTLIESRYVNKGKPNLIKVDGNRFKHEPHRKRIETPRNRDLPKQEVEDVLRTPKPLYEP